MRLAVFRRDGYTCVHCIRQFSAVLLEVDHVVPYSWTHDDSFENLQTLCRTCNRRKGDRYAG
ncbi:HNH endonuclease [Microbacterium sp. ZXX196]|uniref:HNH endonuclease n=1 Tax=Microbacterium sp. ZXX196 TaxID=2609291 RepID=UPI001E3EC977|nr:HNH endonuclease signature motif containing protein [Microbacterium sp. ZXX196]